MMLLFLKVVVHCSGGLGRTGHVLAGWLVRHQQSQSAGTSCGGYRPKSRGRNAQVRHPLAREAPGDARTDASGGHSTSLVGPGEGTFGAFACEASQRGPARACGTAPCLMQVKFAGLGSITITVPYTLALGSWKDRGPNSTFVPSAD